MFAGNGSGGINGRSGISISFVTPSPIMSN
jgi:hypothetical protein